VCSANTGNIDLASTGRTTGWARHMHVSSAPLAQNLQDMIIGHTPCAMLHGVCSVFSINC
jgi:hypothetical protein